MEKEKINLNEVTLLTLEQAKARYNIGRNNIKILAKEIGAAVPVNAGGKMLFNREKLDNYFENL